MSGIVAENLVKTYTLKERQGLLRPKSTRSVEAVKGISLRIPKGRIVGLLGVNGAGKTTMIRMLSSIVAPTSGSLYIDGRDAVRHHFQVKQRLNMITGGERNLYWRLTARENLSYFGHLYGLHGGPLRERIDGLLAMTGLCDAADTPVERYSKGMKQRLQIARGLINDPDYLFLDEPTLGLDVLIAAEMRRYIAELAGKRGKGLLLTTHYISEAEELCDYIYVIDGGLVIAQGEKDELKELLRYKKELVIAVERLDERSAAAVRAVGAGEAVRLEREEDGVDRIRVAGTGAVRSAVFEILAKGEKSILDVKDKEPALEEILISIIQNFRGEEAGG